MKRRTAKKAQLFKDIYKDNLYVNGRITRQSRDINIPAQLPAKPKNPLLFFWSLVIAGVIAYIGVIVHWHQSRQGDTIFERSIVFNQPRSEYLPADDSRSSPTHAIALLDETLVDATTEDQADAVRHQVINIGLDETIEKIYESDAKKLPEISDVDLIKRAESLVRQRYSLAKLFGLGVRTIIIDPGHGGKDPGTIGHLGTHEKDIALSIATRLRDRLVQHEGYKVLMTRESDIAVSLNERVEYANNNNADLFISIHINFFSKTKANFVETYYFGPKADKATVQLAARENANSQFMYADFKNMIRRIGDTMKFQESKQLARAVQANLFKQMHKLNNKISNHGIKPGPFVVLLGLDAPSILTEVTSLNDKQEERRLKSPIYRDKIAMFLENGIINYLTRESITPGGVGNGEEKETLAKAQQRQ